MDRDELRAKALEMASKTGGPPEAVVERARAYEAYLTGDPTPVGAASCGVQVADRIEVIAPAPDPIAEALSRGEKVAVTQADLDRLFGRAEAAEVAGWIETPVGDSYTRGRDLDFPDRPGLRD